MDTLGERPAGIKKDYTEPWFVYDDKIFIYTDSTTKLEAFDASFKPVRHPLAEVFNAISGFRCMQEIVVHPTLPFAIIHETGKVPDWDKIEKLPPEIRDKTSDIALAERFRYVLYLLRWTYPDEKQRLVPIVSDVYSIWNSYKPDSYSHFTFSPDGKWLVFRDETGNSNNPNFVAVPINQTMSPLQPSQPNDELLKSLYLGKPIKLGRVVRKESTGPMGTAWTTDPTAFVMTDGVAICKWDLGKAPDMPRVNIPAGQVDPRDNLNPGN